MSFASIPLIDVLLAVFITSFGAIGFWFGLVHTVGAVIGLFGGAIIAGLFYGHLASLISVLGIGDDTARTAAFFLLLILVSRLFGWAFGIVDRIFRLTALIPFVKAFDRLLGGIFGLVEGLVALGILAFFAASFPAGEALHAALASSTILKTLAFIGESAAPLLPAAIRAVGPAL